MTVDSGSGVALAKPEVAVMVQTSKERCFEPSFEKEKSSEKVKSLENFIFERLKAVGEFSKRSEAVVK